MGNRIESHVEASDVSWQGVLRAMQSTWREQQELAPGTGGLDERTIGSRITDEAGAAGRNFLTDTIRSKVNETLKSDTQPGRVIEEGRLRTNLLSSQPLAFNLFGELAADKKLATRALRLVWPDLVRKVEEIEFEWSPGRGEDEFLGNHSAFDVVVGVTTPKGDAHTIGIEVKYHENLRTSATVRDRAMEVAQRAGFGDVDEALLRSPLVQVFLDHLLACSLTQHDGRPDATFVFLSPVINANCQKAVTDYRGHLPAGSVAAASFRSVTIEEVVGALSACTDAPWVTAFHRRYLDYQRVSDIARITRSV